MEMELKNQAPLSKKTFRFFDVKDNPTIPDSNVFTNGPENNKRKLDPNKHIHHILDINLPWIQVLPTLTSFKKNAHRSPIKNSILKLKGQTISRDSQNQDTAPSLNGNHSPSIRITETLNHPSSVSRRNCSSVCLTLTKSESLQEVGKKVILIRKLFVPALDLERKNISISRKSISEKRKSLNSLRRRKTFSEDLVFGSNIEKELMDKHYINVCKGLKYSKELNEPPFFAIEEKQILLAKLMRCTKRTLVIDLHGTLVCNMEDSINKNQTGETQLGIRLRPYAKYFIKNISKLFEIVVFSEAPKSDAETIVNLLDPKRDYISHILYRDYCFKTYKGLYIKDLRVIRGRDLKDIVFVDNMVQSFSFQIGNGIPIMTWEGDPSDEELLGLMRYLLEAQKYYDMRHINRERFGLEKLASVFLDEFGETH